MTTQTLTDWFNLSRQKPWEPGVYEVQTVSQHNGYSYWDGEIFNWVGEEIEYAIDAFECGNRGGSGRGTIRWRGLSSDPNAKPAPAPKPKARGNRKVTRYVVAETVGPYTSHIDPNAIHGSYENYQIAEGVAKRLRDSGNHTARVFKTKRFRTPEAE